MEQLVVAPEYYKNVLNAMYKQGQDKHFSDVTLKCGDAVFHGHKCILSTQSAYFNALFLGNFSDSNTSEIDLSSVFENEQSFEQVMTFLYTGEVDYTDIFVLARYASFFQIKTLRKLCKAKMKERVCLKNCITYFLFSKSTDYNSVAEMTSEVIAKRFHDYFIHEDNTLLLSTLDLQELLDINCLTYSSAYDILEFIAKWVLSEITTQRIEVAQQVLDTLKKREQNPDNRIVGPVKPCVESFPQLEAKLKDHRELDECSRHSFILNFKLIMEQVLKSEDTPSEETVVFTLSKRKKQDLSLFAEAGDDTPMEHFTTGEHENWETVYDVCLYRPSTKVWYYIESIEIKPCFDNDEDIIPKSGRLLPFERQSCKLNYINGKLLLSSRLSTRILSYHCENKQWQSLKTGKVIKPERGDPYWGIFCEERKRDLSTIGNHVFVWNETVFVIKVKVQKRTVYEVDHISGVYFEIYQMDDSSGRLTLILKSPVQPYLCQRYMEDMKTFEGLRSFVVARASTSMDEILVVCLLNDDTGDGPYVALTDWCMSFVANVKDKSIHFFSAEICKELTYQAEELLILEDTDGFLLAVNTDINEDSCMVVGSYKYHSQELKLVEGLPHPHAKIDSIYSYYMYVKLRTVPMISGDRSLWFFYGCTLYHNDFQNVEFHKSEDGKYESSATEYTPHPFTTLVTAVETKVNAGIFKNIKPCCFLG